MTQTAAPATISDSDMLDTVAMVILLLTGGLVFAYFGADGITNGVLVMVEHIRNIYSAIVQILSSAILGDFVGGYYQEDAAIIGIIFDVRHFLGLPSVPSPFATII